MTRIDIRLKPYLEQIGVTAYTLGKWVVGVKPFTPSPTARAAPA